MIKKESLNVTIHIIDVINIALSLNIRKRETRRTFLNEERNKELNKLK